MIQTNWARNIAGNVDKVKSAAQRDNRIDVCYTTLKNPSGQIIQDLVFETTLSIFWKVGYAFSRHSTQVHMEQHSLKAHPTRNHRRKLFEIFVVLKTRLQWNLHFSRP